MGIKNYKDLDIWTHAMALARKVYILTDSYPASEKFGLISQLRRSSVSIPSNIAEGHSRKGTREYVYHLGIARGSLAEMETQLLLAESLGWHDNAPVAAQLEKINILEAYD